ncbi:pyridoxal-phosphate dependent enzyme [Actinomadura soli]|uniref:threonine ammonia-lyase n=1 Tax=Actinomadura soli TaxID=2508997 RepID=A0A5C4JHU4_9ACTN|nr:pyridoxal-phosphate dependent enzyme [Actinomadura soli]TMR05684.1 pyridoxal-phosphate dependent enzyme [Actinomadura soli]
MSIQLPITFDDVARAASGLADVAHQTPVFTSRALDERTGATVWCKCENLQRAGSFKFRGAYNAISRLTPGQRRNGVVAFSSGNHAQAVALAARMLDTTALIVMPEDAPVAKRMATLAYGAEIVTFDRYTDDRFAITDALAADRGLTLIPPYDHPDVIAGQGSVAIEFLGRVGGLDALVVPIGGGAQLAGCATVLASLSPETRAIGVETEAGDKNRRSLRAGTRIRIPVPRTIADGVTGEVPGELTFAINSRHVDEVITVTDAEILDAMVFLFDRMKLVAEPTGALAVAALLSGRLRLPGRRVGVIISGGNIDTGQFTRLLSSSPAHAESVA